MKKKKFVLKAYIRKFNSLERKDKLYVKKVLCGLGICAVLCVIVMSAGIYLAVKNIHLNHWENDRMKDQKVFAAHLKKEEQVIEIADEVTEPPDEAVLLSKVVNAEVGGEDREAQIAVASVIMNRVESDLFPDTITEVVYQEGQYECVINGAIDKEPTEMAIESAYYVYQNGSQIPCNVLFQAEFHQGSGVWAFIGGEYFCYQ